MIVKITVPDLACSACANTIAQTLQILEPDAIVEADVTHKVVKVETQQSIDAIEQAIVHAGYTVTEITAID
jgi:copper chaperone